MRSILALGLALVVLAAEAPGLFVESPVCAAVDGVNAVARAKQRQGTPSCCGTASCPMHGKSCDVATVCSHGRTASTGTKLCAPSCGREGVRMMPGVPDPGTLARVGNPATLFAAARPAFCISRDLPTRNSVPADPPPRF